MFNKILKFTLKMLNKDTTKNLKESKFRIKELFYKRHK